MSVRTRLAIGVTLSTLAVAALVGIVATGLASWRAVDPSDETRAGATIVDEGVAIFVVAEDSADAAADARADALRWMLVALAVSVVPALGVGWFVSQRLLRGVEAAQAEVEAAERERRRRLDEVVHELRTPLAVTATNLELASSDPHLDADTLHLIDAARRATERMGRTVDDLAEHGHLVVDPDGGSFDVAVEARSVAVEHTGPARARGLQIRVVGPERLGPSEGDRSAVRTALGNLLSNAVRLAPQGSTITVATGEHVGWRWAAVVDEGPGLPAQLHAAAFERGWRGRHDRDRDRADEPGERGLGLTISRQLVEANG
ncbi:MAG: HAMP domain-containing histidine kinase, partial [Ilumatobacteraceae bacterium]|nr:HAMP domain-containing histidine kinase [Ilumatobacteraceae bacterium]